MKRIYIAIVLFLTALFSGALEAGYITAKADMFIGKIENIDKLLQKSEYSNALSLCRQTEEQWYESAEKIDMLLIHDYVDAIGLSISRMTVYAEQKNAEMYFAESVSAKKELASIKESEYPLIENIL